MLQETILASNIVQITSEIYQVGGPELTAPEDAAIYLVRFDSHAALIDAGCGRATNRLLENIAAAGTDPKDVEYLPTVTSTSTTRAAQGRCATGLAAPWRCTHSTPDFWRWATTR